MKLSGQEIQAPDEEIIVIPRNTEPMIFKAKPVMDYSEFDKLCPEPTVPKIHKPGQPPAPDYSDKKYLQKVQEHSELRIAWMFFQSLSATPGLEWETVESDKPETWKNINNELEAANLTVIERQQIIGGIMTANSLNESRMTKARESFLQAASEQPPSQ